MRLDHLLSKETSDKAKAFVSNILRSDRCLTVNALFNLEGTGKDVPKIRSEADMGQ